MPLATVDHLGLVHCPWLEEELESLHAMSEGPQTQDNLTYLRAALRRLSDDILRAQLDADHSGHVERMRQVPLAP